MLFSMSDFDHPALYPQREPIEQRSEYVRLRPAEKAFVDAYLATLGTSARAAGKAIIDMLPRKGGEPLDGHTERANRMLRQPHIQLAITERARELSSKFDADANSLLRGIAAIANANMANYVHFDDDGIPYYDFRNVTYDQMSAISEITVEEFTEGRGEDKRDVRKVKLKLHDKQVAQEKLMRFLQLYAPERLDINMNVQQQSVNVDMSVEQLAEMYQRKLK